MAFSAEFPTYATCDTESHRRFRDEATCCFFCQCAPHGRRSRGYPLSKFLPQSVFYSIRSVCFLPRFKALAPSSLVIATVLIIRAFIFILFLLFRRGDRSQTTRATAKARPIPAYALLGMLKHYRGR